MLDDGADHEIARIALELRGPVDLGPEVDRAVMSAIRAAPLMVAGRAGGGAPARASRRGGRFRWLVEPRTLRLRVSPLGALAAAGIAVAAVLGLRRDGVRPQGEELAGTGEFPATATGEFPAASRPAAMHDTVYVTRFVFVAPDARHVAIAGDFNDWDTGANRLVKDSRHGVWTVDVPLAPGRYNYAFYVDGQWLADPAAPRTVGDDFGRPSSTVTVSL